jgi:triphosphatase
MICFAYACLRRASRTLTGLAPALDKPLSVDEIHRLRIASRKLRVALRLFGDMLPASAPVLGRELQWFSRTLGEARDLDVYMAAFRSYARQLTPERARGLEAYERHLEASLASARAKLDELFASPRYRALLNALTAFLDDAPAPGALRRWRSFRVMDGGREYLQASVKRILKHGAKIESSSPPDDLHRLRIKAKRLRYELEFFANVYGSLARSAKAARRLQDTLGAYQDACTASDRVLVYLDDERAQGSIADLLATHEANGANARRAFAAEWRRFKKGMSLDELRTLLAA